MRRSIVLAVGLLVLLSGCNAVPGGDAGPITQATTNADGTTTADPAETTADDRSGSETDATADSATNDATEENAALPAGLSADGVTDAAALGAAHEQVLEDQSYTYDRTVRVVAANGTDLGRWSQHTQVGDDRLRFNHTQTGEGVSVAGITIEDSRVYTNGSVTYTNASAYRDGYRVATGKGFAATTFSSEELLADALNASETSVAPVAPPDDAAGVSADGQWYRVRAGGENRTFTYRTPNDTSVEIRANNVTATALVAPSGFVRNLTYEYDFERGTISGRRTMTVRYSAIGETTVEVPAWVAEAKAVHENRTSDATEEALVDENGVVREYRVAYTATLGENTSRIERTVQFTALGETTVERPAWVAEETNATAASVQFASSATVGAGATFAVTSAR